MNKSDWVLSGEHNNPIQNIINDLYEKYGALDKRCDKTHIAIHGLNGTPGMFEQLSNQRERLEREDELLNEKIKQIEKYHKENHYCDAHAGLKQAVYGDPENVDDKGLLGWKGEMTIKYEKETEELKEFRNMTKGFFLYGGIPIVLSILSLIARLIFWG